MEYPTYKGPNRFTFKEVKRLFYIKYENGFITQKYNDSKSNNIKYSIKLSYNSNGKVYNYSVSSYIELVTRLDLSNEVIEANKAFDADMVKYIAYTKSDQYKQDLKDNDEFGMFN